MRSAARLTADPRGPLDENCDTPWMVAVTITLLSGETNDSTSSTAPKLGLAEQARQRELDHVAGDHEPQLGAR